MFFGLPDFMILTFIFPLGLGFLIARDAAERGQSNKACLVWLLFTWLLWPIAMLVYYLVVVEKYRGFYQTSASIKAASVFLILLIIVTACAGLISPQVAVQQPSEGLGKNPPKCYVKIDDVSWNEDNTTVWLEVSLVNSGGPGYVKIRYFTNTRTLAVKEYEMPVNVTLWFFVEEFPWTPEDKWVEAKIIEQRPAET